MTVEAYFTAVIAGLVAAWVAQLLLELRLTSPPQSLMKTNVEGRRVPAVIGGPMVLGSLIVTGGTVAAGGLGWQPAVATEVTGAIAVVVIALALAGSWDDRRGDERPRGFAGHFGAASTGVLTGGVVKLVVGGVAGVAAGAILVGPDGVLDHWARVVEVALLVALSANFVNLTDRAPGRAAKVTLAAAVPLVVFGAPLWVVAAAPLIGALCGCVRADLSERAMLGDAGANPLGGVLGLGLAVTLPEIGRVIAIAALLALNLVSEWWSFSRAIERVAVLRALDRLGRAKRSTGK